MDDRVTKQVVSLEDRSDWLPFLHQNVRVYEGVLKVGKPTKIGD